MSSFDAEVTARLKDLRHFQAAPGAAAWLIALLGPGDHDGFFAPEWQSLLRFRVGLLLYPPSSKCRACGQPMDINGDHALSCASAGLYRRHNRIRNYLWSLTWEAG